MKKETTRFGATSAEMQGALLTHIITDRETGVQYLLAISPNLGSGMTALLDREGKPFVQGRKEMVE